MFRMTFRSMFLIVLVSVFATTAFADSVRVTLSDSTTTTIGLSDTAQDETLDLLQNGEIEAGMTAIRWMGSYAGDEDFGNLVNDEFGDKVMAAADELIINGDTEIGVKLQEQYEQYSTARNGAMERKATRDAELAEREAAELAELEATQAEEKAERESSWDKAISELSFENSLAFVQNDTTGFKAEMTVWLSNRWVSKYSFSAPDSSASYDVIFNNLQTQLSARNTRRELLATISGQIGSAVQPLQTKIDAGANADIEFLQITSNLNTRLAKLEAWRPTVESRLSSLNDDRNQGRVNITACMELLKYAKYNSTDDDDNAGLVRQFLNEARRNVETVEYPVPEKTDNSE
jgi:multidrug efflux pump subunit AcrA (membrane-fusion protein)